MYTYLFSDDSTFQIEIKAKSVRHALILARRRLGIRVPLRRNLQCGNLTQYRNGTYGYGCHIVGPV